MSLSKVVNIPAICTGLLCLVIAAPATANPTGLPGIDLDSVITFRDQARQLAHHHDSEEELDEDVELRQIRTIAIDPGHGGDNSGATGVAGIAEKYLTLELAYQLRERLQQRHPDLRVVMTRYGDETVGLSERVHRANLADADLLLSLHYNAAPHDRAIGFETYFLDADQATPGQEHTQGLPVATIDGSVTGIENTPEGASPIGHHGDTLELIHRDLQRAHLHDLSGTLAEAIQHRFVTHIDSVDRGVKQGNFTVLQGTHMPAVVVEAGFLTHPREGLEVTEAHHRSQVTDALVEAIEAFDEELADQIGEPVADELEHQLQRISHNH